MESCLLLNTTKSEILMDTEKDIYKYLSRIKENKWHSPAFISEVEKLFQEFMKELKNAVLIDPLPIGWGYEWRIDYFKMELRVTHHVIKGRQHSVDQTFSLISVPVQMLTAEEFAARYEVKVATVSQWIRRNRIRTAYKIGRTWWISALTEKPARGYVNARYRIPERVDNIPDKYEEYMAGIDMVALCRDEEDMNIFHINLYKGKECIKDIRCENSEREAFESILIANPNIEYLPEYRNSMFGEIVSVLRGAKMERMDETWL